MSCYDINSKKENYVKGKFASLSVISDVKGTKPYRVIFENPFKSFSVESWSKLILVIAEYIVATFSDDGGRRLKDSKAQDGYGIMFFLEGKQKNIKYAYINEIDLSVYKCGGSNLTIEIVKEICKLYAINTDDVLILYK